jgi:hypothetical protein
MVDPPQQVSALPEAASMYHRTIKEANHGRTPMNAPTIEQKVNHNNPSGNDLVAHIITQYPKSARATRKNRLSTMKSRDA